MRTSLIASEESHQKTLGKVEELEKKLFETEQEKENATREIELLDDIEKELRNNRGQVEYKIFQKGAQTNQYI